MSPQRIQLRRTAGWRKPEGAIVVSRPTRFGNPYRIDVHDVAGMAVIRGPWQDKYPGAPYLLDEITDIVPIADARRTATERYRAWLHGDSLAAANTRREALRLLRGHDLACWCPPDDACHVDPLLQFVNGAR